MFQNYEILFAIGTLGSIIPPNKTVVRNYICKKDNVTQQLSINNVKLTKIQNPICYVNINGEEKSMKLDDLKSMLNNKKQKIFVIYTSHL